MNSPTQEGQTEVRRYSFTQDAYSRDAWMERSLNGEYVEFNDYDSREGELLAKVESLTSDLAQARREVEGLLEKAAVTAWMTGMDMWGNNHPRRYDSREVGSACAVAIRALAPVEPSVGKERV